MDITQWEKLTPEEKTLQARRMSQKEWNKLFPPKKYSEPVDASGFSGEVEVTIIK